MSREPVTPLEAAYEAAKVKQREAIRAVWRAEQLNWPATDILRLKRELDQALIDRRRAFAAYMDEEAAK